MRRLPYGLALLLASQATAWAQDLETSELHTVPIRGNLYMLQGRGGNITVATGPEGTLLVDDEYAALTDKVVAALAALTDRPVGFVINTHWHHDHSEGNEYFGSAGALIVANDNSRARLTAEQFDSLTREAQPASGAAGLPVLTFSDSMRLRYNGDTIDVIHLGPAHTDGDAVVFFREANVLLSGDLYVGFGYRPPYIDQPNGGSTDGMVEAAGVLANLIDDDTIIVPGHGDLATRAELIEFRDKLAAVRDYIEQAIARGQTESEVVAGRPTEGFARAGFGTDRWVRTVYQEYR